jgi:hypothetical protein
MNRILFYLVFLFSIGAHAQVTTRVSGKVYDVETLEPLPFVNVAFKGTNIGTACDVEGKFTITTFQKVDSVVAMYIGYTPTVMAIKYGQSQTINIPLKKASFTTKEVVITPGENPAFRILRGVWAHKPENDKEKLSAYEYEVYNKLEFDLNNIDEDFKKRKVLKPVDFIFDHIDSANPTEKPHLPLFFSETVSDFYYRKNPKIRKEVINGSRVSGVQDASISQFTGEMYQNVNIYDNNMIVFGKTFVSPISENGIFYYRYYLIDSMDVEGTWCYHIQFKPKRKQELLFVGNMWIADTSFAVKRIEMSITEDANINYVNSFWVVEDFEHVGDAWMLKKEKVVADFSIRDKKMGVYGRKTTSYRNIVVNKEREDEFYTRSANLVVEKGAEARDETFWQQSRHDSLSHTEKGIYTMIDSVQHLPIYKTWEDIVIFLYSGYKIVGPVEIGPWYKMVSGNQIEGVRLRVGGRTSNSFSRWVELSGYAAYGLKDEQFKYSASFKTFITKKPRQLTGINYKNDYEILGLSNNAFTSDNVLASIFRTTPLNNMTRVEQYEWWYERDLFNGFNARLSFVNRNMSPLGGSVYEFVKDDQTMGFTPGITTTEARLGLRFAYDEKFIEGVFTRTSVGTHWPVLQLQYVAGFKGVLGSDYAYHRASLNVDDRLRFNPFGYLNYILEAGKIWGTVPFPLLVQHPGNQTLVLDWSAFNTMNYFEFASDQYVQVNLIHHFDGFFFNKIPLLRKLKWREVASFRAVYGSVSDTNKDELLFPGTLFTLNRGPYMETGVGIENIFRFFRIDYFWRLNYLDNPGVKKFGLRFSLQILF